MKEALFIGGTGTISMGITKQLAKMDDWHLTLLNRGNRTAELPEGVDTITVDINDEEKVRTLLQGRKFDCVCDFIVFTLDQVERDYRLFNGITAQYMCISSASAYHKPLTDYLITESTTMANPYWQYSRDKIEVENFLFKMHRENDFPATIIRPSHTYDDRSVPLGVHGKMGSYQVLKRMLEGKPVIIHGDGTSLWTMTHNSDFAKGFIGLMGNPHAVGEAYQITGDESLTWNQIYEIIASVLGVELKACHVSSYTLAAIAPQYDFEGGLIGDKANSVVFDNSKLKRAVPGFTATVEFADGIRMCIENILAHPELQIEDPEFDAWCDRIVAAVDKFIGDVSR